MQLIVPSFIFPWPTTLAERNSSSSGISELIAFLVSRLWHWELIAYGKSEGKRTEIEPRFVAMFTEWSFKNELYPLFISISPNSELAFILPKRLMPLTLPKFVLQLTSPIILFKLISPLPVNIVVAPWILLIFTLPISIVAFIFDLDLLIFRFPTLILKTLLSPS